MSTAAAPLAERLATARETAGELWRWWTGELAGMLPARLREGLLAPPPVLVADLLPGAGGLRLGRLEPGRRWSALPAGTPPAGLPAWLRLPEQAVLTRRIEWPAMSTTDLRRAARLDLDRQTPLGADALWFDVAVVARDAARRRLVAVLAVARREAVEAALARLAAEHGLHPARIGVAVPGEPAAMRFDLRPAAVETPAAPAAGLLPRGTRGRLLLLCALLGLINLGLHAEAESRRQERLDQAVAEARQRAQRVEALRTRIAERRKIRDDIMARRGEVSLLAVLDQLTRLLPDDAWLDSVEVRGASVYLTGHAPVAVSLVALIESSPMFADAQFRSPVTLDRQSGRERFDMSVRLRGAS